MPLVAVVLIRMVNDKSVLPERYLNTPWLNAISVLIVGVTVFLGIHNIGAALGKVSSPVVVPERGSPLARGCGYRYCGGSMVGHEASLATQTICKMMVESLLHPTFAINPSGRPKLERTRCTPVHQTRRPIGTCCQRPIVVINGENFNSIYKIGKIPPQVPPQVATFGGAFSNHIAALASASKHIGIRTIGIIRGEQVTNPTLETALANGMQLLFVDRSRYRKWTQQLHQYPELWPEGLADMCIYEQETRLIPEGAPMVSPYGVVPN
ncbi:MAG: hypothetical protein R2795_03870 [Saprospiraceae bacterium]